MNSFVEQIRAHVWPATRLALANYCGLKDGADVAVTANNISPHINVSFVPSPHANESIPADLNIDLEPNPPPHLQLPKRDAYALDAPPEPAPVVSKPEQPQYRTELDTPEGQLSLVPWHKRPLTGRIPVAGRKY